MARDPRTYLHLVTLPRSGPGTFRRIRWVVGTYVCTVPVVAAAT